jgi:hypothetical protein
VLVSCGTCLDQLLKYQFDKIFPGCRLMDIHEYLAEKGVKLEGVSGAQYMYHDPCHTPMKLANPLSYRQDAARRGRQALRALLRRIRHLCQRIGRTSPPRSASARRRKSTRWRGKLRTEAGAGAGQGAHLLPFVPARSGALRRGHRGRGRLYRRRTGQVETGRELDGGVHRQGQQWRHRKGVAVGRTRNGTASRTFRNV